MKWVFLFGIYFCAESVGALTLEEAISIALSQNPEIRMTEASLEEAEGARIVSRSQFFPQLTAQGTYTRFSRVSRFGGMEFGEPNNYLGQILLEQSLFTWGKVQNNYRIARLNREASEEELRKVRVEVIFRVKETFYRILFLKEYLRLVEDSYRQVEHHARIVSIRYEEGIASRFDLIRANVETSNLKPEISRVRNTLELATLTLKDLIGVDRDFPLEVQGELSTFGREVRAIHELPLQEALEVAKGNRPEMKSLLIRREMAERSLSLAKARNKPNLVALGRFNYRNPYDFVDQWGSDADITLSLVLPIFDGFATQGDVRQSKARLSEVSQLLSVVSDQLDIEVEGTFLLLKEAEERIGSQRESVKEAEEGLVIAERQYQSGVLTNLEFLDAQLALTRAKTNYLQAMNDYLVSNAMMEKVLGR